MKKKIKFIWDVIKEENNQMYKDVIEGSNPELKNKFDYVTDIAQVNSDYRMYKLSDQYNLKWRFALSKKDFAKDELFKASEELTKVNLDCNWKELDEEIGKIQDEIKRAKAEDQYFWPIDHSEKFNILFLNVISGLGLTNEYLNIEIKDISRMDFDTKSLKDFDNVIELLGRFQWVIFLINMIEGKEYDKKAEIEKRFPPLPDCFININYWNTIIKDPRIIDHCEILEDNSYKWISPKNLLAGFAQKLKNKGKLIEIIKTNQDLAKVFCPYFNVDFNPKNEKGFQPNRKKIDEFYWII